MNEAQDIEELFRRLSALSQRVEAIEHAMTIKAQIKENEKPEKPEFFQFYKENGDLK